MKKTNIILLTSLLALCLACGGAPVKEINLNSILNGTFAGNTGSLMIQLTLNGSDKSFTYNETGGITARNYSGTYVVMGQTIIFKNSDGKMAKHKATVHSEGFTLTCIENTSPISFKFEPLAQGEEVKFFRQ